MTPDNRQFVPRRPRHAVNTAADLCVEVERSASQNPARLDVGLVDLSRSGFGIRSTVPLDKDESFTLLVYHPSSGLRLTLPAIVQWQSREAGGSFYLGCWSVQQIPWETLGELFLNHVLTMETPGQ